MNNISNAMAEFGLNKDDKFVDIHGRELPTINIGPQEETVCLLTDLKQTGVAIYQKSQYAKLSTLEKEFDLDFVEHMLEAAKSYMLANKCSFTHQQIESSIEHCKQYLNDQRPVQRPKQIFKDREIAESGDNLVISVTNVQSSPKVKTSLGSKKQASHGLAQNSENSGQHELKSPAGQKNKKSNTKEVQTPTVGYEGVSTRQLKQNLYKHQLKSPTEGNVGVSPKQSRQNLCENEVQSPTGRYKGVSPTQLKQNSYEHKSATENINLPLKSSKHVNSRQKYDEKILTQVDRQASTLHAAKNKFSYNVSQEEHEVMVTAIDKPNCIWVRDVANDELFEKIHHKVNEEAEYQEVAKKPWVMDKVYMAQDEDSWFRCKIFKFNPLTVFFVDYGTVAEVNEIRNVSDELANTPCMAVRITFKEVEYKPRLEDVIHIKRFFKNDDGTYFVNVAKQSSNPKTPSVPDSSLELSTVKQNQLGSSVYEQPVIVKKPTFFCVLKHDQRVLISHLKDDEFYLRTRECFDKLQIIEKSIQDFGKTSQKVKKPKVDQVVLYENKEDSKFYRAVTKFFKNKVDIEFLDYGKHLKVDLSTLRFIDEKLAMEPMTLIKGGKLIGFENRSLEENCRKFVDNYIETRQKFTVVLGFDDELDLFDGTNLLSKQLQNLTAKRVLLKDIKTYKPEIGLKPYLCGCFKNSDNMTLVLSDELEKHIDYILRAEIDDNEPYTPISGEVCLCYYVDNWYRCVATRIFDKECEVLLLDFGNIELIKKADLRKAEPQITDIPALAIPCVLIDLPPHPNVENLLKKMIMDGEIYNIEIKKISDGKCQVEIPTVYKKIQDLL